MAGDQEVQPPTKGGEDGNHEPDRSQSKARMLIRLVAGGCFLIGGLDLGLYLFQARHNHTGTTLARCLWLGIPLVAGVWLLVKTASLAEWIDNWLDE
jgi:hypothetical protein